MSTDGQAGQQLPLNGIRVIDFSQGVAGPHIGMLLAQQGADVIKIEPVSGDWGRQLGSRKGDVSAYGMNFNQGKRSIVLNLKNESGSRLAARMTAEADVVIEAYRPGVMARLGLDYESVCAKNPKVVYVSVTGFGQTGPNTDLPATDVAIQGFSGLMMLNRPVGGLPQRFPMIAVDVVTGLYGAQAVLGALVGRATSGQGRYIDCSLMQSSLAFQAASMVEYQLEGGPPKPLYAPLGAFKTSDGYVSISCRKDEDFAALCGALEMETVLRDPRFATMADRILNGQDLTAALAEALELRPSDFWISQFVRCGVIHARVRDYGDILDDEDSYVAGYLRRSTQPGLGQDVVLPVVPGVPRSQGSGRLGISPLAGADTREILKEMGIAGPTMDELFADGAVR